MPGVIYVFVVIVCVAAGIVCAAMRCCVPGEPFDEEHVVADITPL